MLAAFIVLYILADAVAIVVFIRRRQVFAPVLAIHQNRSGPLVFTSL